MSETYSFLYPTIKAKKQIFMYKIKLDPQLNYLLL